MAAYRADGARLGWLLIPHQQAEACSGRRVAGSLACGAAIGNGRFDPGSLLTPKPRFYNRPTSPPAPRMKAVILAGGLGTRLAEETHLRPKPMVEVGGKPILWHILKTYSHYDINEFIICCGYKGYMIKEYFANYFLQLVM
jgi:hypothetical protein